MRQSGQRAGELFGHFSDAAQRTNVYTTLDYVEILQSLIKEWRIENINGLTEQAEKARDYVMALPSRLIRIADRIKIPEKEYQFKWIAS
jgi:acyl-[acyl-carrier-protein] desaturase